MKNEFDNSPLAPDERAAHLMAENEAHQNRLIASAHRRSKREKIFTQGAMLGGIAGAFSLPITFAMASWFYQSAHRGKIPPSLFYDPLNFVATIPVGAVFGLAAGTCWAAQRARGEASDLNAAEAWGDALGAVLAVALGGCFLSPFLFGIVALMLGVLLGLLSAIISLF